MRHKEVRDWRAQYDGEQFERDPHGRPTLGYRYLNNVA
jgi:hypothetical protein